MEKNTTDKKTGPPDLHRTSENELVAPGAKGGRVSQWKAKRIDPTTFPDQGSGRGPPTTIDNVRHVLQANGIDVQYNTIKKSGRISIPGMRSTPDNRDGVAFALVNSLLTLNGLSTAFTESYLGVLADENAFNPVEDWIRSRGWDGKDRLHSFYRTLTTEPDFPEDLKRVLMRKWLLSCVAAALKRSGFRCRGVLTLQGPQGIGKTTWGKRLISDEILSDEVIKTDHHLDGGSKDSRLTAVTHFIVEVGELEASFKRDVARLKGFLTADSDKIRRPYGKADSEYPRRTVFYATVNQSDFLVDHTGNSRWWTLPVMAIDYDHDIDMQQLFAQLAVEFENGAEWWLGPEEEEALARRNRRHNSFSLVRDMLSEAVNFDVKATDQDRYFTASELLKMVGLDRPTNAQAKECGSLLRASFGEPKRVQGRDRWRVPMREDIEGIDDIEEEIEFRSPKRSDRSHDFD